MPTWLRPDFRVDGKAVKVGLAKNEFAGARVSGGVMTRGIDPENAIGLECCKSRLDGTWTAEGVVEVEPELTCPKDYGWM